MSIRRNLDFTILKIICLVCINRKYSLCDNLFLQSNLYTNKFLNTPFTRICEMSPCAGGVTASYHLQSRRWREGVGQHHTPATSSLRKHRVPIVRWAGWALGPHWTSTENPRTIQCVASRYTDYTTSAATKTFRGV